jgi:hypothetical protein
MTIQYVHVYGGWIYSASSTNYGSGYSYQGGSLQLHNNVASSLDLPLAGRWRENFKVYHLYVQRTRGTLYCGPNFADNGDAGVVPMRNIEVAYNWIEYTGSGGSEGKCWFEGDNSFHHNVVIGCGTADYTNFHGGLLILSGTGKVYNNWIEEIGDGIAYWSAGGYPHGTQNYIQNGPIAGVRPWGVYGPYSTFDYEVYNNVIINCGQDGVVDGSGVDVGYSDATVVAQRVKIYNNTIVGSSNRGVYINRCTADSFIKNNVLIENASGATVNASATVSDNTTTGTAATVFVDAANDNYHLATLTPSASGTEGVDIAATDYDDVARPQGAAYERGAYED